MRKEKRGCPHQSIGQLLRSGIESAYTTLERKFQLFQFRLLELLRICSIIKLEDSGVDQLSVAMKQWTGSVSADCGARPWVEREPQAE